MSVSSQAARGGVPVATHKVPGMRARRGKALRDTEGPNAGGGRVGFISRNEFVSVNIIFFSYSRFWIFVSICVYGILS